MKTRTALGFAAIGLFGFGLLGSTLTLAQKPWPERSVRIVVPAPPGSAPISSRASWARNSPRAGASRWSSTTSSAREYAAFINAEIAKWRVVIRQANMKPD